MKSGKPEGRFDIISITLKHKMLYLFFSDAFKINHKARSFKVIQGVLESNTIQHYL